MNEFPFPWWVAIPLGIVGWLVGVMILGLVRDTGREMMGRRRSKRKDAR
jgi:hypothetical protein